MNANIYSTLKSKRTPLNTGLFGLLLASGLLAGILPPAKAGLIIYTDRTAFNAAAATASIPVTTEGYESYANDLQSGARTITLSDFNVSYDLNGDISQFGVTDLVQTGVGPTAGSKYLFVNYPTVGGPTTNTSFLFGTGIRAFGTDIKDLDNANLTFSTSSGANGTAALAGGSGNLQFFGIISDQAFTSISFSEPPAITGDGVGFDQTSFGIAPIPEPSTAFFGTGVAIAGILFQRTRKTCNAS